MGQPLVVNIGPGLPLTPNQKYEFHMTIDGEHVDGWLATFYVQPQQPAPSSP